jgi:hypothetical protein
VEVTIDGKKKKVTTLKPVSTAIAEWKAAYVTALRRAQALAQRPAMRAAMTTVVTSVVVASKRAFNL